MKKHNIEESFIDYFDGNMSGEELKKLLADSEEFRNKFEELDDLKKLYNKLDCIHAPEPGENLDKKFYNMLENISAVTPKKKSLSDAASGKLHKLLGKITLPKISFASLFLIMGILAGKWLMPDSSEPRIKEMSSELKSMKEVMMLTLLQQPAPTERIKAVSYVNSFTEVDSKVANALIETLNTDPDINVRLATIDALAGFCQNPHVRQGLIQSIARQKSPLVQVALADLMVSIHEKKSVEQLRRLLSDKEIKKSVKVKIENCITRI